LTKITFEITLKTKGGEKMKKLPKVLEREQAKQIIALLPQGRLCLLN